MGQGIIGAIPVSFKFYKGRSKFDEEINRKQFTKETAKDFFDYYDENQEENKEGKKDIYFTIKPKVLLPNFKSFFLEFQRLIGNEMLEGKYDIFKKFNDDYDKVVDSGDIDKFLEYFDDHSGYAPTVFPYFDAMYITTNRQNLLIYQGSYKASLEEWSTLKHMEYLLRAAMQHPLAKIVRFGMMS